MFGKMLTTMSETVERIETETIIPGNFQLRRLKRNGQMSTGPVSRTLLVFFGWLGASDKALSSYFRLYHDRGFDVLFVPGLVRQFLWPPKSMELAEHFMKFICQAASEYHHFLIHAVSIGAYNYTSCLMLYNAFPPKYSNFIQKLRGIIFDSITFGSTERMVLGVSGVATNSRLLRAVLVKFFMTYIFFTYPYTLKFYEKGVEEFSERPLVVPSLYFYSKDDLLCDGERLDLLIEDMKNSRSAKFPIFSKTWTTSVHAAHLKKHNKDYMEFLNDFLKFCDQSKSKL